MTATVIPVTPVRPCLTRKGGDPTAGLVPSVCNGTPCVLVQAPLGSRILREALLVPGASIRIGGQVATNVSIRVEGDVDMVTYRYGTGLERKEPFRLVKSRGVEIRF